MKRCLWALLTIALFSAQLQSGENDDRFAFFENKIRPVLIKSCYPCHSADVDDIMGGLRLDSRDAVLAGGDSGPAIVPSDPNSSLLLEAIGYDNRDLQMPPEGRLSAEVVADFNKWIAAGAADPRVVSKKTTALNQFNLQKRRKEHWAWQPPRLRLDLMGGVSKSIDSFVDAGIASRSLTSSTSAEPRVLVRRLYFDLIGLPPTPKVVEDFLIDYRSDRKAAYSKLVDDLLVNPHFGEHWARHWMDVVRFSETKGHVTDQEKPFAWKYRDYVIDAFNNDVPFDRMVVEHLAGDHLVGSQIRTGANGLENEGVIATGFLFMHEMHFMAVDPVKQRWDEVNAQIDVVGKAFLGLTTECARCHDHKFDAISQQDYYALAGVFWSTEQARHRTAARQVLEPVIAKKVGLLESDLEKFLLNKQAQRRAAQNPKASGKYFPVSEELGIQSPVDTAQLFKRMAALAAVDPSWSNWSRAAKNVNPSDVSLLVRGEHRNEGPVVQRGFLAALNPNHDQKESLYSVPPGQRQNSGRLWLARQIASQDNPLTARVWVNRIWLHLLGRGIVDTPNNFGKQGAAPSNLPLLDFLAIRLMEEGWSTQSMIRQIVNSNAYQRTSRVEEPHRRADPMNRFVSFGSRRRLTAEQLRDAMLAVSGSLVETRKGPSVDVYVPSYASGSKPSNIPRTGPLDGDNRRSLYIKVRRNYFDPFMKTFDFPDPGKSIGKRSVTMVTSQSLAMMNSPLVHEIAADWGERIAAHRASGSEQEMLTWIWQKALQRDPTSTEVEVAKNLLAAAEMEGLSPNEKWKQISHLLFNHPEFMWLQ